MRKLRALRNKKGFTLVEVVVVLVIIAILAAALVTSLGGYIGKARQTSALLEANNVYTASQAYLSECYSGGGGVMNDFNAMTTAVNEYLGGEVVATGKGTYSNVTVNELGTITAMIYIASNGQTVTFEQGADDPWTVT